MEGEFRAAARLARDKIMAALIHSGLFGVLLGRLLIDGKSPALFHYFRLDLKPARGSVQMNVEPTISKVSSRIIKTSHLARLYLLLMVGFPLMYIVKYIVIEMLASSHLLDQVQPLDCLLIGRVKVVGRTGRLSSQLTITFLMATLAFRLIGTPFLMRSKFKFYVCLFLMTDYKEIEDEEFNGATTISELQMKRKNSIIYLEHELKSGEIKQILRPNRTCLSWLKLNYWTRIMLAFSLLFLLVFCVVQAYMLGGFILTNTGFEISYPACVSWLRDRQNESRANGSQQLAYSYIYVAPQKLASEISLNEIPFRIPFDLSNIQRASVYMTIRLLADIFDNIFVYAELALLYCSVIYLLSIVSLDIMINAREIKRRLVNLLSDINHAKLDFNQISLGHHANHRMTTLRLEDYYQDLARRSEEHQAILLDHFELTMIYNRFGTFMFSMLFVAGSFLTLVVYIWMVKVEIRSVEDEFAIIEIFLALVAVTFLISAARVYSENLRLYPVLASLMAYDSTRPDARNRWSVICMYYHPRPLFCFTAASNKISWLFNLKVSNKGSNIKLNKNSPREVLS